jgi:hypothetical protein
VETEARPSVYEQSPVRLGPTGSGGRSGLLATIVALAVVTAIAKPWTPGGTAGQPGGIATAPPSTTSPSVDPATLVDPAIGFSRRGYDPMIFGFHEPPAAWGIWPAGFLVTFGFVIQVPDVPPAATQVPKLGGPHPSQPAASPSGLSDETSIAWPAGFEVPDGNHLLLIGINMPLGHAVLGTTLSRLDTTSGAMVPVALERLKSPWPTHFVVVALAGGTADLLSVWPAGQYRLDVTFGPEGVTRSIEIIVAPSR